MFQNNCYFVQGLDAMRFDEMKLLSENWEKPKYKSEL